MDIKKHLAEYKWVLVFALIVAVAAGVFAWRGDRYNASLALTVSRAETQNAEDYKYDNYYALRATDEFGRAVEGWFKTPEFVQAVYQRAGLDLGSRSMGSLSRIFKVAKLSPTTVEVRFGGASLEEVKAKSQAIVAESAQKTEELSSLSGRGVVFSVTGGEPVVIDNSADVWQKSLIGLIIGLVFGVFVKIAGEYFKEN